VSAKKGIAAASFGPASILTAGASWYYNWRSSPNSGTVPAGTQAPEYVPMIHDLGSVTDATINALTTAQANGTYKYLLGFNEPDQAGQANMTVAQAIAAWPRLMGTGLILGSPAPSWPTITWLSDFMTQAAAQNLRVDFVCLHYYRSPADTNSVTELKNLLTNAYNSFKKPIWLTEFGAPDCSVLGWCGSAPPLTQAITDAHVKKVLAMLENLPFVQRYAWFMDASQTAGFGFTSIFNGNGSLTQTGIDFRDAHGDTVVVSPVRPLPVYHATASSELQPAAYAIDGTTTTRWESAQGVDPQWIRFDMGSAVRAAVMVMDWEAANAKNYTVEGSNDSTFATKTTLVTKTNMPTGQHRIDSLTGLTGSYRYYRMYGTARNLTYGYSIWETRFYSDTTQPVAYTIAASAGVNGTISPSGTVSVNAGANQTFIISPNGGYVVDVVKIDGAGVGAVPSYTFSNVTANHTITAAFKTTMTICTLTTTANPSAGGSVTGGGSYNAGAVATVTAAPAAGYTFAGWSGDVTGTINPVTVTLTANRSVAANFALKTFTVTPSAGSNGTISPATAQTVTYGGSITFTFTPSTGYAINAVTVDGGAVTPAGNSYTISNVTANHTIAVAFNGALVKQTVAGSSASSAIQAANLAYDGNINTRWESTQGVDPQWIVFDLGSAKAITTAVLDWETASAKNYTLEGSNDATFATRTTLATKTNMTSSQHRIDSVAGLTGSYRYYRMYGTARSTGWGYSIWETRFYTGGTAPTSFMLSTAIAGTGSGTITLSPAGGSYAAGTTVTVTATPGTGSAFTSWSGDLTGTTNPATIVINGNKSATATFTSGNAKLTIVSATASSNLGGNVAANVYDGNMNTRWESTQGVDPQWIYVDLGSARNISEVKISWEAANAKNYTLEGSNDATFTAKTVLATETNMAVGNRTDDIPGLSGSYRYIRVYGTARNLTYGYSIWEMEVDGN
jgi:uncharacterized repeat protein (TIGR02543 family)